MNLHNIMEDIVLKYLDEMIKLKKDICNCEQCKNDILCYTLNRINPMYIVSSRGIIHTENRQRYHFQDEIDILTTLNEAIEIVSNKRRHEIIDDNILLNKKIKLNISDELKNENHFNFPQIVGRIIDSTNMTPVNEVQLTLYDETGKNKIRMFDDNWQNPETVISEMKGTYVFWPAPVKTYKAGIQKDFQMSLAVKKDNYEPISKFLYIRTVSSKGIIDHISKESIYYIDDVYITKGSRRGGER